MSSTRRLITGAALLCAMNNATAKDTVEFDRDFMRFGGGGLDLDTIVGHQQVNPGRYSVMLSLNKERQGQYDIEFVQNGKKLTPCLPTKLLESIGVRVDAFTGQDCIDLEASIDGASVHFNSSLLQLDISVPQIAMNRAAEGYVPSEQWDNGINALVLNYRANAARTEADGRRGLNNYDLYLEGGLNIEGWRLRSSSSFRNEQGWERNSAYLARDLPGTMGTLTLGESTTNGDIFQSVPFRGVQLATDYDMLPDSMQGYAPVIRGIANSQAKVEIKQYGYSLYSTYVAPGPFEIKDLNAASGSGDLEVIITEASGEIRRFTQPYATLGNLLREGNWRYSITAGQYHESNSMSQSPAFTQGALSYGLGADYTLSGGVLIAEDYRAFQLGVGKGLGSLGAVSLDVTQSKALLTGKSLSGKSYSVRYGKSFETGTNVRFAGYRYNTEGYRDFAQAVAERDYDPLESRYSLGRRNRLEVSVSQDMTNIGGSFYLNYSQQNYWGRNKSQSQVQMGFNTQINKVSVGLYATKSLDTTNREGAQVALSLSMPLGRDYATVTLARNTDRTYDQQLGISGTRGEQNQAQYNVTAQHRELGSDQTTGNLSYGLPWAQVNGGANISDDSESLNLGVAGSLLAHAGGVELGQSMGETAALVRVDNTADVAINGNPGALTNSQGYSLVPYLRPYRNNRISLDTSRVDPDVEIAQSAGKVTPRRGAVVLVNFKAVKMNRILLTLLQQKGQPVPFGSEVTDDRKVSLGVVSQGGQILVSVDKATLLNVKWGPAPDQGCKLEIDPAQVISEEGLKIMTATCSPL